MGLEEQTPDHSTLSKTRRMMNLGTHQAVFRWVLKRLAAEGLLSGMNLGVDATTLEANAALKSIVRRDGGARYNEHVTELMKSEGIEEPTPAERQRFDRKRKKSLSNRDWVNPHDREARITKMKDGRTHLAYKAEHAVDLETGAIVALTVQPADRGDTASLPATLVEAGFSVAERLRKHRGNRRPSAANSLQVFNRWRSRSQTEILDYMLSEERRIRNEATRHTRRARLCWPHDLASRSAEKRSGFGFLRWFQISSSVLPSHVFMRVARVDNVGASVDETAVGIEMLLKRLEQFEVSLVHGTAMQPVMERVGVS